MFVLRLLFGWSSPLTFSLEQANLASVIEHNIYLFTFTFSSSNLDLEVFYVPAEKQNIAWYSFRLVNF